MLKNQEHFLYNLPSLVCTVAICNNRVSLCNKEAVATCNNYPKEHEKISLEANLIFRWLRHTTDSLKVFGYCEYCRTFSKYSDQTMPMHQKWSLQEVKNVYERFWL